jgi:GNAT superfamily N-acetyltransferase/hypoxanthine-guanine phosphoribosyltransferase
MNTLYLGNEEVDAYLNDLAKRLQAPGSNRPMAWFPIGRSGEVLVDRLLRHFPELGEGILINRVNFDRKTSEISFTDGKPGDIASGRHALIIDSSVHSGGTMLRVLKAISVEKPASVASYTLVLKRSSMFVPSLWGVMINDHDRAYFLLEQLPNNRLHKAVHNTHIRRLTKEDINLPVVVTGLDSMDRITWADRYYDMACSEHERRTYLLEQRDEAIGYLTVSRVGTNSFRVDEVAVGQAFQDKGHAGTLLRWAETCARQMSCERAELWAIENEIKMYEHCGFEAAIGVEAMDLAGEKFFLMYKRLIHHL